MNPKIQQSGVTMVELITVILIGAILTAIAVPSYKYVTNANRVSGEINSLLGDLQFTRYEAIKEGLQVTICPTASATTTICDVGSTTWSEGWIVLSNPLAQKPSAVLRRQLPFSSFESFDTLTTPAGVNQVIFNREGFSTGAAGTVMFSLHSESGNSSFTRCLMVSAAGSLATTAVGNVVYSATCS